MAWSFTIARPAGIEVRVHLTFFALLAWAAGSAWAESGTVEAGLGAAVWVLAVFGIVVLHELGHALAARRYGCLTKDILLLPIGGVARLEKMPERPREELVVALAGPAVNAMLAIAFAVIAKFAGVSLIVDVVDDVATLSLLAQLVWINVVLGVFNLVPAFPMDGGRALRALLAMRIGRQRATRIAAGIGKSLAAAFGFVGLFGNPVLVLIAVFVWFGASAEVGQTELEAALQGARVEDAMVTRFWSLPVGSPISAAVDAILAGFQAEFPVMRGPQCVGILGRDAIVRALGSDGPTASVEAHMQTQVAFVPIGTSLTGAVATLREAEATTLLVMDGDRVVGLLDAEQIGEFVMLGQALRGEKALGTTVAAGPGIRIQ
jgi:Zn-dependent protease